jgi:sodium/pantothenate symporter
MNPAVITSLLLALVVYIAVGVILGRRARNVADLFPLLSSRQARVDKPAEFSASTVATTISLATVVMAFFELAGHLGVWLFWTVITTSAGLFLVRLFAKRIWKRISAYDHRPTLHEFLGKEYNSGLLCYVAAICTSLGFLGAFAVELTVGSRFFAGLVPGWPTWPLVIVLSIVAFVYTSLGGFRAVIVTDRIQMISIWLSLLALPAFYIYYVVTHGGWAENFAKITPVTLNLSYREGLISFLLGIFVINVPAFVSDMSIWQRITAARKKQTIIGGLWGSVFSSAVTWGGFALLACCVFMIVEPAQGVNPLLSLLRKVSGTKGLLGTGVLFVTVLGLYGAMLSTASTQLIAVSHTLYEDVFSRLRKHTLAERLKSKRELNISRSLPVIAAIISTILVQLLSTAGFSIVDLVFAIYGAQLGLCPLVISALFIGRQHLKNLSIWAVLAVSAGFITGWGTAIYGRFTANTSLVFLAPVSSLIVSSLFLGIGFVNYKVKG